MPGARPASIGAALDRMALGGSRSGSSLIEPEERYTVTEVLTVHCEQNRRRDLMGTMSPKFGRPLDVHQI
jgi:hypothetical protein